jgi:hypothetical protein
MAIKAKDIYKGRQKTHKLAKLFTVIAAVLVIGAVSLFFGLRQYAVYDENGDATLIFPWEQSASGEDTPAESEVPAP